MTSRSKTQSGSNAKTLLIWLGGAIAVIGLVAIVVSGGTSSGSDHPDLQGAPTVTGERLARFVTGQADAEAGKPVPEVRGADFDGTPVTIENNGKAKLLLFLAHWCPNCQAEVPEVVDWLAQNEVPADVEIMAVATSISRTRDNFPPSDWLERENWPLPVILDSPSSEVGIAFGASAFPIWAMVDADGNLVTRISGAGQVDLNLWTTALSSL
ncbi:MAG: TlpA family protein disulfide reductase [Acidimicrobiia bacterium]|nr:TlpA family protein disulfide reductase [Acidimicrobiia bacterium]